MVRGAGDIAPVESAEKPVSSLRPGAGRPFQQLPRLRLLGYKFPMTNQGTPTVRKIAELTDVHFTTVAKILRGKSRAAEATRRKVLDMAEHLGYRPSPMASAWMAQRRAANPSRAEVNFGFVFPSEREMSNSYNQELRRMLQARAEAHGYASNEFMLEDYKSREALAHVLNARGIKGVVWSGIAMREGLPAGFEDCSMCSFGGEIEGIATVRSDALEAMRVALARLRTKGFRRPVLALIRRPTDWNLIRYEAAFRLAYQRRDFRGAAPVILFDADEHSALLEKVMKVGGADSVVTNVSQPLDQLPTALLDARPGLHMGIDQRRSVMAKIAVDLVANALVAPRAVEVDSFADISVKPVWVEFA